MRQTPDGAGTRTGQAVRPLRRQHGARVALALTRALRESGGPAPYELFVASSSGPALHVPVRGWSEPDEQLVTYLRDLGGTPRQLFDDPDLLALFLPTLRADLTVIGTCPANDEPPLATPVRAFAGAQDTEASARTLAWRQETTTAFDLDVVACGYFFTPGGTRQVLESIAKDLSRAPIARWARRS